MPYGLFEYDGTKRHAGYGIPFSTKKDACLAIIMILDLWVEENPKDQIIVIQSSPIGDKMFSHYNWDDVYEWLGKLYCERAGKVPPCAEKR